MKPARFLLAALLLISASAAWPQSSPHPIRGAGTHSCAAYLEGQKDQSALGVAKLLQRYQWVLGFLSAYNDLNRSRFLSPAGVFGDNDDFLHSWLSDACKANPQRDLYEVTQGFISFRLDEDTKMRKQKEGK